MQFRIIRSLCETLPEKLRRFIVTAALIQNFPEITIGRRIAGSDLDNVAGALNRLIELLSLIESGCEHELATAIIGIDSEHFLGLACGLAIFSKRVQYGNQD